LFPNKTLWEEINMSVEEAYEELEEFFGPKNRAVRKNLLGSAFDSDSGYWEDYDVFCDSETEIEDAEDFEEESDSENNLE